MPSQRGGKPRNEVVAEVFQQITAAGRALPRVRCRHCQHTMAIEATRQHAHLNRCNAYINRPIILSPSLVQTKLSSRIKALSISTINALNRTAAMAVYMFNLPFNHYENPYVRAHERAFHLNYTSPSHTAMAGGVSE
jgi:hypothetical protein